jgi:hypothetical protein
MKKFIFILANIVAIASMVLGFSPLFGLSFSQIGLTTILIMAVPGIMALVAIIVAFINKFTSALMFMIIGAIFLYFSYYNLLDQSYYLLSEGTILAGLLFLIYARLNNLPNSKNLITQK